MNEQLPLKRIFIGFVATITAGVAVTAAGTINDTVLRLPDSRSYVLKSEAVADDTTSSTEASVVALNHEETKNSSNITKLIDLTVSSSAFKAVSEAKAAEPEQPVVTTAAETAEETQEEYKVEEWWKAELSDYTETLEQQELIPIETEAPVPEELQPLQPEVQQSEQPVPETPSVIPTTPAPSSPVVPEGSAPVKLPETLSPGTVYFTSYGYGHGVGMSQNGANFYAKYGGYDYTQILAHYYPGTTLVSIPGGGTETISVRGYTGSAAEIIAMVCNAEIGSSFEVEAIKAQAVAAYTYVKYAGGSTSGMAIKPGADQKIIDAVNSVLGQALYYDGSYALTLFCASSGGCTASNKDIIVDDIPYLRSVASEYDEEYDRHYGEMVSMSVDTLRYRIQNAYGISLSSDYGLWIQPEIGDGGYVRRVNIDGQKTVNGYDFARAIGLKSARFAFYCN